MKRSTSIAFFLTGHVRGLHLQKIYVHNSLGAKYGAILP